MALGVIVDLGTGRAADGHGRQREKSGHGQCENAGLEVHDAFLYKDWSDETAEGRAISLRNILSKHARAGHWRLRKEPF